MLFRLTDEEIIEKLKINPKTLDEWKQDPEFAAAVFAYVKENRRTVVRLLSQRYVEAARELESLIKSKDEKVKHKVVIDLLKSSGLLKDTEGDEQDILSRLLAGDADDECGAEN